MSRCFYITLFVIVAFVHAGASWIVPGASALYAAGASGGAVALLYVATMRKVRARSPCGCGLRAGRGISPSGARPR